MADRIAVPLFTLARPARDHAPAHLVPNWFQHGADGWTRQRGADDADAWMDAAYSGNRTLVTRVGPMHADDADVADRPEGLPTSSSTLPALVVMMYQLAMITDAPMCWSRAARATAPHSSLADSPPRAP